MAKRVLGSLAAAAGSLVVALLCFYLHSNATIAAIFLLLAVLLIGAYRARTEAIAASLTATLCLDYFFIPPIGKITIADPQDWLVLTGFLAVSLIATNLSAVLRRQRD
jgi:two-component system sensor histidine kinase KdpD